MQLGLANPASVQRPQPYEQGLQTNSITPPQGFLQQNGALVWVPQNLALVNGANENVILPNGLTFIITGPTAVFSLGGLTGGVSGRYVIIYNGTGFQMTLNNLDVGSISANRIATLSGANLIFRASGFNVVTLQYIGGGWNVVSSN